MKKLISILCALFSLQVFAQGTMSTDDTEASEAPASLSGYTEEEIDLREEEVQMQEDDYIPEASGPITIEEQEDSDRYRSSEEDN